MFPVETLEVLTLSLEQPKWNAEADDSFCMESFGMTYMCEKLHIGSIVLRVSVCPRIYFTLLSFSNPSFYLPTAVKRAADVWRYSDQRVRRVSGSTCEPGTLSWAPLIVFFLDYSLREPGAPGHRSTLYNLHGRDVGENRKTWTQ
jgi:hypothetical protein